MRSLTISSRLVLLILVAATPVFLLHIFGALERRAEVKSTAEAQLVRSARLLAAQQLQFFLNGRDLLAAALIIVEEQVSPGETECRALLDKLLNGSAVYLRLDVATPDGRVVCSSDSGQQGENITSRSYVSSSLGSGAFTIGEPTNGTLPIAYAPRNNGAEPSLISVATLDLDSLSATMSLSRLPEDAVGVIFNEERSVLARVPPGTTIDEIVFSPVTPGVATSRGGGGLAESDPREGSRRIWAVADLLPDQGLFVAIGVSTSALFANADRNLWRGLGVLFAMFVFAALVAWAIGQVAIKRPIDRLTRSVSAMRSGDLGVRHKPISNASELRRLEEQFNHMASALHTHEEELLQRNAKLNQLIQDKEMLVREMNHRVKNSLQLVSSVVGLQQEGITDPVARERLSEAQARVGAVAKVHERIYAGARLDCVEVGRYLRELCADLERSLIAKRDEKAPKLTVETVKTDLSPDRVVPLGMITVELVTNALKHAGEATGGAVRVSLRRQGDSKLVLSIEDTGPGFPEDFRAEAAPGLGLRVSRALAQQLGSELIIERTSNGSRVSVAFAAKEPSRQ